MTLLFLALSWAAPLAADWRAEVMAFLEPGKDYAGAAARLAEIYDKVDADDKPSALSFLAFLEKKAGRPRDEARRVIEYFETFRNSDPVFLITDDFLRLEFIEFWARWKASYPLVSDMVFLEPAADPDASPPSRLLVGLDLSSHAYYKISSGGNVLEGGLWPPGFHILKLPFTGGYDRSGRLEYDLDLKSGNLVVRKRITIDVDVRPDNPVLTLTEPPADQGTAARARPITGEVSLYIDDALILKSKRIAAKPAPIKFKLPGPSPEGTKPYMAPRKDIPQFNGVSILDAVGILYKTIKDLGKKRKEASISPPVFRKTAQVAYTFSKEGPAGEAVPFKAFVSLKSATGTLLDR